RSERESREPPIGQGLGKRRSHGLRKVAGPCKLPVVRGGIDEDGRGLDHILPESHQSAGSLIAPGSAGLAYVYRTAAQAVRGRGGEPRGMSSRQRVAPRE